MEVARSLSEVCSDRPAEFVQQVDEEDARSVCDEPAGDGFATPSGSPGDDRDLCVESIHGESLLSDEVSPARLIGRGAPRFWLNPDR
jgi:hypothetical protein